MAEDVRKKITKIFKFKKSGRGKPVVNHEDFMLVDPGDSVEDTSKLQHDIGVVVHGEYHAVHGWDTPLVNRLVEVFVKHEKSARIDEVNMIPINEDKGGFPLDHTLEMYKRHRAAELNQSQDKET